MFVIFAEESYFRYPENVFVEIFSFDEPQMFVEILSFDELEWNRFRRSPWAFTWISVFVEKLFLSRFQNFIFAFLQNTFNIKVF